MSIYRDQLITSWYCKVIKSFSVPPIGKRTVLVNRLEIHIFAAKIYDIDRRNPYRTYRYLRDRCIHVSD